MFPRKPVAGFYESHDSFIGHGIIQHDGNPQFVVHVIGRIDAGNLVEAVRLFRPDFYIEDINLFGIVVFVEWCCSRGLRDCGHVGDFRIIACKRIMYGRVAWRVPALLGNPIIGRLCGGGFFGIGRGDTPPPLGLALRR